MGLLLGQPRDDASQRRGCRDADRRPQRAGRHRGLQLRPVHRVVDDVYARRVGVHLADVEVAHRFRGDDHAVGSAHQQALGEHMMGSLLLVDVHFGTDNDRHARQHRGGATVQAGSEQECVHDVGLQFTQMPLDPEQVPGPADAWIQTEHPKGHAGLLDFLTDRASLIDARDEGLETIGKMPDQVEHHLFRAAHHEGVGEVQDARAARCHEATCA